MAITYEIAGAIATITIDRQHVSNAVDGDTADELFRAFEKFEADAGASIAILTGAGKNFCTGGDLKAILGGSGVRVDTAAHGPLGPTWMLLSKPVIAAVEGHAVAGGLELALWCDLRVAARDATFGVYCRRWGVPLSDGGTVRLPRLIGHSRALDMILTGRGVSGEEAERMGLVNRLCEPGQALARARELAAALARLPQACLRSDRLSSYEQWDLPLEAALQREAALSLQTIATGELFGVLKRWQEGEISAADYPNV
jgi:enoyl-CoA hydratase